MKTLYLGLEVPSHLQKKDVVHYPIIKIIPRKTTDPTIQSAFKDFKTYTHLIFTSRSAVSIFFEFADTFAISYDEILSKTIIALGKRTAAKLQEHQVNPAFIAEEETAEGIVKVLDSKNLKNSHIFLPQSSLARPVIKNWLQQQKIPHVACPIYDTIPNHPLPPPDLSLFEEIIFTSPSTVDAFLNLYRSLPSEKKLSCIGTITENYLHCV